MREAVDAERRKRQVCLFNLFSVERDLIAQEKSISRSGALTTDSAGELHVLGHDGDSLGVDGAEVGVLEDADDVGLGGFLEGQKGLRLEPELVVHVGGDSPHEALEGSLREEHVDRLLIPLDLTEDNGTGPVSRLLSLLHAAGGGSGLLNSFGGGDLLCGGLGLGCDFSLGHLGGRM